MKSSTDVIKKALQDPTYAETLRRAAEAYANGGLSAKGPQKEFLNHFASSPEELEELVTGRTKIAAAGPTTLTTATTTTTGGCTTTTTTTITTTN